MSPINGHQYYPRYYPGVRDRMPGRLYPGETTAYKDFGVVLTLSDNVVFSFDDIHAVCVDLGTDGVHKFPVEIYSTDAKRLLAPCDVIMRAYER